MNEIMENSHVRSTHFMNEIAIWISFVIIHKTHDMALSMKVGGIKTRSMHSLDRSSV